MDGYGNPLPGPSNNPSYDTGDGGFSNRNLHDQPPPNHHYANQYYRVHRAPAQADPHAAALQNQPMMQQPQRLPAVAAAPVPMQPQRYDSMPNLMNIPPHVTGHGVDFYHGNSVLGRVQYEPQFGSGNGRGGNNEHQYRTPALPDPSASAAMQHQHMMQQRDGPPQMRLLPAGAAPAPMQPQMNVPQRVTGYGGGRFDSYNYGSLPQRQQFPAGNRGRDTYDWVADMPMEPQQPQEIMQQQQRTEETWRNVAPQRYSTAAAAAAMQQQHGNSVLGRVQYEPQFSSGNGRGGNNYGPAHHYYPQQRMQQVPVMQPVQPGAMAPHRPVMLHKPQRPPQPAPYPNRGGSGRPRPNPNDPPTVGVRLSKGPKVKCMQEMARLLLSAYLHAKERLDNGQDVDDDDSSNCSRDEMWENVVFEEGMDAGKTLSGYYYHLPNGEDATKLIDSLDQNIINRCRLPVAGAAGAAKGASNAIIPKKRKLNTDESKTLVRNTARYAFAAYLHLSNRRPDLIKKDANHDKRSQPEMSPRLFNNPSSHFGRRQLIMH